MSYMRDLLGRRLDSLQAVSPADAKRLTDLKSTYSSLDTLPALLDLHYESKMGLYGPETFTRAATDTYTDMTGTSQTAAINTPAFDRVARNGWLLPAGLKLGGSALATFDAHNILPAAGYTILLETNRPSAFSNNGKIFSLNDGGAPNRVEIGLNSSYQPYFIVQASGSVVVNQALGNVQSWYGGPRRLAIAVKSSAFAWCDDGGISGSASSGSAPAVSALTHLDIGNSSFAGWVGRVRILPGALSLAQVINLSAGLAPVACWGDSLTAGTGATGAANYYPELLRLSRVPHSAVYNGGVGGDTSTQIRTRALADTVRKDWTTVIWAGRNNIGAQSAVLADIAAMVANLTHKRFLILGVINKADGTENSGSTAYNQIVAINQALAAAYPNNYLDIRAGIVAASGGSNDAPNASWSADGLHLNNTGYTYVADQVSTFLRNKSWF